jgi:hypothetical protein
MSKTCERCGAAPPPITSGPFAGSPSMLDYCIHCSKDLCDDCLRDGRCTESLDGKHERESDDEETE